MLIVACRLLNQNVMELEAALERALKRFIRLSFAVRNIRNRRTIVRRRSDGENLAQRVVACDQRIHSRNRSKFVIR